MTDNNDTTVNVTQTADVSDMTAKLEKTTIVPNTTEVTTNPPNQQTNDTINPVTKPQNDEETKLEDTTNDIQTQNTISNTANNNVNTQPMQNQNQPQIQTQTQTMQPQQQMQNQPPQMQNQNQNQQTQGQDDDDLTNLIINYLPPTMSEGTLATLFSPYGLLERCKIVVDLQTLRSRGYGFVKYDNAVSAERALTALNGYELNGKKLKVAFARPQCKAITNANLYITNVPAHFTDNQLRKLFDDYGKIVECRVLLDQNGQSRGVGFVRMDTHHNAIQALQAMDQYVIDDKHPPLLVKLAQRRVPRRYWNSQNRNQGQGQGGGRQMGGQGGMGGNKNKKKKRNSPGRKYYPKGNYSGDMGGGGQQMGMGGQNGNRQSPNKRGYYRPRQQGGGNRGGGGGNNMKGRGGGNNNMGSGGPPYFPAPMYQQQQEPYGMPAYGQPQAQYAANLHMTAAAMNNPNNPQNNIGPKRNKQIGNWD